MRPFERYLIGAAVGLLLSALMPAVPMAQDSSDEIARIRAELAELKRNLSGPATGAELYRAACAACHGLTGNGWGPGAKGFAQRATNFKEGVYKLRSTFGKVPAPGDLERTIRLGMSGTEMVPFKDLLTEQGISAVADYLRTLSPDLSGPDAVPDEDDLVEVPDERPFERTDETVAEGAELYESLACIDCHGPEGRGNKEEVDDWDFPVIMVSFREGYYKSGSRDQDLYRSIATGMLGTSMGPYLGEASEDDIWKLVDYIRSFDRTQGRGFAGRMWDYLFHDRPSGFDYSAY